MLEYNCYNMYAYRVIHDPVLFILHRIKRQDHYHFYYQLLHTAKMVGTLDITSSYGIIIGTCILIALPPYADDSCKK